MEMSMRCIHFGQGPVAPPGAAGQTLLVTDFFTVARRTAAAGDEKILPAGKCAALMFVAGLGPAEIRHDGVEPVTSVAAGETVLLPAGLQNARLLAREACSYLEITLGQ